MKKVAVALTALALILVVAMSIADRRISGGFQVGEAFPDLVLPSLENGRPLSLAHFRGKKIIRHVFASW